MNNFEIPEGWLPMPINMGPPLPRFLNIRWPWLQSTEGGLPLLPLGKTNYISPSDVVTSKAALTTYENIEEIEFPNGFDPETFMPKRIVIHRKASESR